MYIIYSRYGDLTIKCTSDIYDIYIIHGIPARRPRVRVAPEAPPVRLHALVEGHGAAEELVRLRGPASPEAVRRSTQCSLRSSDGVRPSRGMS